MKLAFSTLGCPDWDVYEVARRAAQYGYRHVELRCMGDRHIDAALGAQDRLAIRRQYDDLGISVCSLAGYTRFNNPDAQQQNADLMRGYFSLAHAMGAPYIRSFIGTPEGDMTLSQVADNTVQALRPLAREAADQGLCILLETHDAFSRSADLLPIIEGIGSPGAAVLWDVEHPWHVGGETMAQTWAALGRYVRHIHMKDARGEQLVLCGEGDIPLSECFRVLKEAGYSGAVSLEWEKMWHPELAGPEIALPQFLQFARQYL